MRKKKPFCCWVLIILVTIAFVIYVVQFVKFNTRVKRFDQIKIGSEEMEAYILLGEPSKTICGIEGDTLREFWKVKLSENDLKGKKFMLLVYDGSIYLRKDLFCSMIWTARNWYINLKNGTHHRRCYLCRHIWALAKTRHLVFNPVNDYI